VAVAHQHPLDDVLNLLNRGNTVIVKSTFQNRRHFIGKVLSPLPIFATHRLRGFPNSAGNFSLIKKGWGKHLIEDLKLKNANLPIKVSGEIIAKTPATFYNRPRMLKIIVARDKMKQS